MAWGILVVLGVIAYLLLEQLSFQRKKQGIPGPWFVPPFLGNVIPFLLAPWSFYRKQDRFGPVSWNSFFGEFVLFSNTTDVTRSVFLSQNFRLWLAPGAKELLGDEKNIAFMHGEPHKQIRTRLLPLFSRKALAVYLPIQERLIRHHFSKWLEEHGNNPFSIWPHCRDLNIETSTRVFVGPYVKDLEEVSYHYLMMNQGFLCIPFNFPGFTFRKAVKSRERMVVLLNEMVGEARKYMKLHPGQPRCLLDVAVEVDEKYPEPTPDLDLAYHVLDFLFASQDASTSSLVWVFHLLAEHPDVLARVREEQYRLRPNDEPIDFELLSNMTYTRQVMKEILRFRPPAVFVPHEVPEDSPINSQYKVKKGTIILPSVWHSSFEGYENADKFDPDRFGSERREDVKYAANWLVFGTGAHTCMGKEYAMNHLTAFIALAATNLDWERIQTKNKDGIDFRPTIVPSDGCMLRLFNRKERLAAAQGQAAAVTVSA